MAPHPPPPAQLPRYFANDAPLSSRDPRKQLISSLEHLVTAYPPDSIRPGGGLYHGPISIAYLFFTLQEFYSDLTLTTERIPMGTWCAVYLKTAQDAIRTFPSPLPSNCGIGNDILTLLALGAASSKDRDMARDLCDYVDTVCEEDASNEWLYGRAGYLYLLRLVRASFEDDEEIRSLIQDTEDDVIDAILTSPRPFKWRGKAYAGAAHGIIGIITQVVLTAPRFAPQLEAELGALLSYQSDDGNWPSSIPPTTPSRLHFCHGAPGIATSLESIKQHFPHLRSRIDASLQRARKLIWDKGLLTKEPCLCHGISGNALALGREEWTEHFLSYTTRSEIGAMDRDGMMERSEEPAALWTGEAGRAWAWAVVDKGLPRRFLGYNDI